MVLASILFAFTASFAKLLAPYMSSIEIVFFRNIVGLIIILVSVYKIPLNDIGGRPFLLLFRGSIGFLALIMYFYNIANIPLAQAVTFSKTAPIFTAIFAYFFIKEKLSFIQVMAIILGFIGILFITEFKLLSLSKTDWFGILSGVGAALAYTSIRELKHYYSIRTIVLSFMVIGTFGPILLMIIANFYTNSSLDFMISPFVVPSGIAWFYILGLGSFATFSQIYMTKAYSLTKAGIVGTISYSNIIFAIILGVLLGDAFPNDTIIIGIFIIIVSGIIISTNKPK
jgi:drug/metabolite transporter (DMT)-like permease